MATCPLCEKFTGSPESVEAHISGSNDEDHEGKIGREFRDRLRGAGEKASGVIESVRDSDDSEDSESGADSGNGKDSAKDNENGGTLTADPPGSPETDPSSSEPPEFLQSESSDLPKPESPGNIESAKLEEDEDGNVGLTLFATGLVAWGLWSFLQRSGVDGQTDPWENV